MGVRVHVRVSVHVGVRARACAQRGWGTFMLVLYAVKETVSWPTRASAANIPKSTVFLNGIVLCCLSGGLQACQTLHAGGVEVPFLCHANFQNLNSYNNA